MLIQGPPKGSPDQISTQMPPNAPHTFTHTQTERERHTTEAQLVHFYFEDKKMSGCLLSFTSFHTFTQLGMLLEKHHVVTSMSTTKLAGCSMLCSMLCYDWLKQGNLKAGVETRGEVKMGSRLKEGVRVVK